MTRQKQLQKTATDFGFWIYFVLSLKTSFFAILPNPLLSNLKGKVRSNAECPSPQKYYSSYA